MVIVGPYFLQICFNETSCHLYIFITFLLSVNSTHSANVCYSYQPTLNKIYLILYYMQSVHSFPGNTTLWQLHTYVLMHTYVYCGRTVGRAVKALDSQPRVRGFESLHTLSLQYLKVPGQDLYPKCAPVHSAVNENLAIHRESYCTLITRGLQPESGLYAPLRS